MSEPAGGTGLLERTDLAAASDTPWQTLLWNDPVNLEHVVTHVLMEVLGCPKDRAQMLMLRAHTEGRAAIFDGPQDKCQSIADRLGAHGLWATIEKAGS